MRFLLAPRSMTLNWKTTYFPILNFNMSQTVRTAFAPSPSARLSCFQQAYEIEATQSLSCKTTFSY